MQEQSRRELIERLEQESVTVKTTVTTSGSEEAALQQAAVQQRQRILDALRRAPISGRLVVHLRETKRALPLRPMTSSFARATRSRFRSSPASW